MPVTRRRQTSAIPAEVRETMPEPEPEPEPEAIAAAQQASVKEEEAEASKHVATTQPEKSKHQPRRARLPGALHFPLLAASSLCIMSMGYSIVREYTSSAKEYVSVTRPLETWGEVALLASWRIFELALGWYGDFDSYDLAALAILSHGPTLYLLHAFYGISISTTLGSLLVEILCTFVPFRVLRPLSSPHASGTSSEVPAANRAVISDQLIQVLTTALAAGIYGVAILTSFMTFLPTSLVLYFHDIPSVEAAHVATWAPLTPVILLFGIAARVYVFTPTAAQGVTEADARAQRFDPVESGLKETLWYNLWGWHSATKVTIKRTTTVVILSGGHTLLTLLYGINGVETTGAVAYTSVWVAAAILTGFGLGAVGSDY